MATMAQQRVALPTPTNMSMTDARRHLAAKPRSYGLQPSKMQPPTPQMRNSAGQMGPAVGIQQHAQAPGFSQFGHQQQALHQPQKVDTVPAMLSPGEAVIPQPQAMFLNQQGLLDNALGMSQQQMMFDAQMRQRAMMEQQAASMAQQRQMPVNPFGVNRVQAYAGGGIVPLYPQGYATGGVVPTTGITNTQPTLGAQLPVTGVQSLGPRPITGPVAPTPQPIGTDWARLRQEIGAFGQAPTLDDATMARMRAIESQRLGNLYRGQLSELGAAAASSGALYGGDVSQLAAGFAAQRGQQEAELGLKYGLASMDQKREDFYKQFDVASRFAQQRESQSFSAQEADLDRRWRTGERLSTQDWQTLEAAKERQFSRSERIDTQNFTSAEAEIARKWQSGERLSEQEWRSFEAAMDRTQQTKERLGAQQFTAEESQRQRALITDENAKDRLTQVALAEKSIEATRANLETQLAQARSENNLDRVQQLEVQRRDLDQQYAQLRQQNDQFLSEMGLRRDVFDRGMVEFDLTRADQISQFAQSLTQQTTLAQMDDATRRWAAELNDRLQRDINAAEIDPSTLQTLLSTIGTIAAIPGLGELVFGEGGLASDAIGALGRRLGIGDNATVSDLETLKDAAGTGEVAGSGIPWSTVGQVALGAAGAAALIEAFNDPKSFARTAQMIAGGAAIGSVLPGIGTLAGAAISSIAAGIGSAFGPSAGTVARDAFTKEFDKAYPSIEQMKALPPTDPNSWANPQNRLAYMAAFAPAVIKSSATGTGDVEISDPDWQRMERLGLAAGVAGPDRSRFYAINDPRVIAMMGPGAASEYFTFEMRVPNDDWTFKLGEGGIARFIADGGMVVRDKTTGEVIDFNNPEQLKAIAARNNPTAAPAGVA